MSNHTSFWLHLLLCMLALEEQVLSIPFFGPFRTATTTTVRTTTTSAPPVYHHPHPYQQHPQQQLRDQRIINADHGGFGVPAQSSFAGGNIGYSPWIPGTKDQFIRNQLVLIHPDSTLNREPWKESGYLNPDFDPTPRKSNNASSTPKPTTARPRASSASSSSTSSSPHQRARKLHRKSKQQQLQQAQNVEQTQTYVPMPKQATPGNAEPVAGTSPDMETSPNMIMNLQQQQQQHAMLNGGPGGAGGYYDYPHPLLFRDLNGEMEDVTPIIASGEPILYGNNLLFPITAQYPYPYQPRAAMPGMPSHQQLPPEAMIQFLKSPEQELSPLTRPQVKLPFPLSRDCSASGGGSKPLQFVVLPIVEPVAPLKPIFPKPSFLSQYGQFPYIPPFNLFKRPPVPPSQGQDSSSGGGSGQFVPILNRPAPPLPFVFVQSLPLELIGQNQEMDVIHSSASSTSSENQQIKEIPQQLQPTPTSFPVAAPVQSYQQQQQESFPIPSSTRPLPLIVIEKVKTPGQPPSSSVSSAATVVEISKSTQKNGNSGSPPHSTISVVQPITAPGSRPPTRQQQHEIQKAIEKLVPVAAAVLENVEQQQQKQNEQEGRDRDISNNADVKEPKPNPAKTTEEKSQQVSNVGVPVPVPVNDQERLPLRPPLRPATNEETVVGGIPPLNAKSQHKRPDISSSEEKGTGSSMSEVEVMEA